MWMWGDVEVKMSVSKIGHIFHVHIIPIEWVWTGVNHEMVLNLLVGIRERPSMKLAVTVCTSFSHWKQRRVMSKSA